MTPSHRPEGSEGSAEAGSPVGGSSENSPSLRAVSSMLSLMAVLSMSERVANLSLAWPGRIRESVGMRMQRQLIVSSGGPAGSPG